MAANVGEVSELRPIVTVREEGVAVVVWTDELQQTGWLEAVAAVSQEVEEALQTHARVEALVAVDDERGHRVATWSGLRREGVLRGVPGPDGATEDRILYARLATDVPVSEPDGFRALLNSFLPRKRAISQMLVRDNEGRVLLCQLTYKQDWDLPGGVVEVGESPQLAVSREVEEELGLEIKAGNLLLTDWLPPWGGWDDALCLVFDGGSHDATILDTVIRQEREIRAAEFCDADQVAARCADFTARRILAALANLEGGPSYTESGI